MGINGAIAIGVSFVVALAGSVVLSAGVPATCGTSSMDGGTAAGLGVVSGYSGDQLVNASTIAAAGSKLGVSPQGQTIAIMTAMGESSLRNLTTGDEDQGVTNPDGTPTDSVGLFQQQHGWGTLAERMDPATSARLFYEHLRKVDGWEKMTPTAAAHAVQGNADPNHYTRFFVPATTVYAAVRGAGGGCGSRAAGDDYPFASEPSIDEGGGISPLGYYYGECVDFVAWRMNRDAGVVGSPWKYTWSSLTPLGGNAIAWKGNWEAKGWTTSKTPVAGAVAWWSTAAGLLGHVSYVQSVNPNGTVTLEEYNWGGNHSYNTRSVAASSVGLFLYPPSK